MKLPISFPHEPPKGYCYEVEQFKRNVISIWLRHPDHFNYTDEPVRTIWGFFNTKKELYYAPINHKKVGKEVNITDTRNYTSMLIQYKGLESFFV